MWGHLRSWNPPQTSLSRRLGERVLFRFSYLCLVFWWDNLYIQLSLELLALASWVPLTPRVQNELLHSSCRAHQPQPAGSN